MPLETSEIGDLWIAPPELPVEVINKDALSWELWSQLDWRPEPKAEYSGTERWVGSVASLLPRRGTSYIIANGESKSMTPGLEVITDPYLHRDPAYVEKAVVDTAMEVVREGARVVWSNFENPRVFASLAREIGNHTLRTGRKTLLCSITHRTPDEGNLAILDEALSYDPKDVIVTAMNERHKASFRDVVGDKADRLHVIDSGINIANAFQHPLGDYRPLHETAERPTIGLLRYLQERSWQEKKPKIAKYAVLVAGLGPQKGLEKAWQLAQEAGVPLCVVGDPNPKLKRDKDYVAKFRTNPGVVSAKNVNQVQSVIDEWVYHGGPPPTFMLGSLREEKKQECVAYGTFGIIASNTEPAFNSLGLQFYDPYCMVLDEYLVNGLFSVAPEGTPMADRINNFPRNMMGATFRLAGNKIEPAPRRLLEIESPCSRATRATLARRAYDVGAAAIELALLAGDPLLVPQAYDNQNARLRQYAPL
jgi:hypothetical protein